MLIDSARPTSDPKEIRARLRMAIAADGRPAHAESVDRRLVVFLGWVIRTGQSLPLLGSAAIDNYLRWRTELGVPLSELAGDLVAISELVKRAPALHVNVPSDIALPALSAFKLVAQKVMQKPRPPAQAHSGGWGSTSTIPPDTIVKQAAIGANMRRLRQEAGVSLQAVARLVGVTFQRLSDIERGIRAPAPETCAALCRVYSVSEDVLVAPQNGKIALQDTLEAWIEHVQKHMRKKGYAKIIITQNGFERS